MSNLLDEDDDLGGGREREVTLSTGAILGIFFGLVLLCGLFFAFGYNMGSHKASAPTDTADLPANGSSSSANFNTFKPAAGSPASSSSSTAPVVYPAPPQTSTPAATTPVSEAHAATPANTAPPAPVVRVQPAPAPTPAPTAVPANTGQTNFMVQIAAVSRQDDADMLVSSLRSKGYAVAAHTSPSDQLIHIQAGPFGTRRDAEIIRQHLLGDGYNAILK